MASDTLVERQIDDGRKLVEQLPQHGFDVLAGMWLKTADDGAWHFHLISPRVDAAGHLVAYRELLAALRAMASISSIHPLEITLVGPSSPLGQAVMAALGQPHGPQHVSPVIWRGYQLGDVTLEGAYLYPVLATTP
jgi:hypothetical protein